VVQVARVELEQIHRTHGSDGCHGGGVEGEMMSRKYICTWKVERTLLLYSVPSR
jgi:hypothetical protein